MKRINKEDLPKVLTEEVIEILIEMALEFPQSKQWHEVFDELDKSGQLRTILERVRERQKEIEKANQNTKTDNEKLEEEEHRQKFYDRLDSNGFYGNMGQPETPRQYKDKYGVWPPGYDECGNKIV